MSQIFFKIYKRSCPDCESSCVLRVVTKRRMTRNLKNNPNKETTQSYLGLLTHGNAFKLKEELREKFSINPAPLLNKRVEYQSKNIHPFLID